MREPPPFGFVFALAGVVAFAIAGWTLWQRFAPAAPGTAADTSIAATAARPASASSSAQAVSTHANAGADADADATAPATAAASDAAPRHPSELPPVTDLVPGPPLMQVDAPTHAAMLEDLSADLAERVRARLRQANCPDQGGRRWRSTAQAAHALVVLAIPCGVAELPPNPTEAQVERQMRYLEYPMVLVARDGLLDEVHLPGFMYESGSIVDVTQDRDAWPVFDLTGTVYECDGEDDAKEGACQSEGTQRVVYRKGQVMNVAAPDATRR